MSPEARAAMVANTLHPVGARGEFALALADAIRKALEEEAARTAHMVRRAAQVAREAKPESQPTTQESLEAIAAGLDLRAEDMRSGVWNP